MGIAHIPPLEALSRRLHFLGKLLGMLCCAWIVVVGTALMREMTPDDLEHHRAPSMQERVKACEGEYQQRFACADAMLLTGQRNGATEIMLRLGLTLLLPSIAWAMWKAVTARADRLCGH